MGSLFTVTSVANYNANPPSDDGVQNTSNQVKWATIKTKLADTIKAAFDTSEANISAAFVKTIDGSQVTSTAVNYGMSAADQGSLIKATVAGITITTPDAGSVGAPFTFAISNQSTGTITLAGNATNSQTVDGQTTQVIKAGAGCIVKTDGTNWFTFGLKAAQLTGGANPPYGFDAPVNLQLNASVASNILTVAIKTNSGNDPSPSDPVLIPFRDATIANGDPVWISITSALSITTNATGATLGTQNGVPFRFWIVAFNNAGTPVLALWHSGAGSTPTVINPLSEWTLQSTTGISSAATSAGVFYTPNGTNLSSCAFRIIGFLEYSAGLTTAGTYASVPTRLQLFGPGIHKPGSCVQIQYAGAASLAIAPSSAVNLVKINLIGDVTGTTIGSAPFQANMTTTLKRGATTLQSRNVIVYGSSNGQTVENPSAWNYIDNPGTTASTTYSMTVAGNGNAFNNPLFELSEIMA